MMSRIFKPRSTDVPSVVTMATTSSELPYFPAKAPEVFSGPPEPVVALFTPVFSALADVVDRPGSEDLARPTPCPQWDVDRLRDHILGWVQFFAAALEDPERSAPRLDPDAYRNADDGRPPGAVVRDAAGRIERTVRAGVAHERVVVSQSVMDGSAVLAMMLGEYLVHGWDLAHALDLPWTPADDACEAALAFSRATVAPEFREMEGAVFGPEVVVPEDAPALDRLLAFSGRTPRGGPDMG
jgi:uncharacterized protein (TIGR03086 family)